MDLKTNEWEGMKWINVAEDGDMGVLLSTVITFWFHKMQGISYLALGLLASART
jgi:hypothetical protein